MAKAFYFQSLKHGKVDLPKFPPDASFGGVHSTTFDPELRNEVKIFFNLGGTFHNF